MESLKCCGIIVNEVINEGANYGPYRHSDRKEIYRQYADILIAKGDAYYAFDTPEQLETLRSESEKAGNTFIYNAAVREKLNNSVSLQETERMEKLDKGEPYVIR